MRVYPAPKRRGISVTAGGIGGVAGRQKKLRRLPHIFSKVLELPLGSDAEVAVHEGPTTFRFTAPTEEVWDEVRAHAIEIHPGVMKVVIRDVADGDPHAGEEGLDELELDRWRFRLPPCTRPALATAHYVGGLLIVTVPKGGDDLNDDVDDGGLGIRNGDLGIGRLVFVQ
ncbi:hypothetical protein J5N97_009940 [Dioscorea zingiberensis]|uniref:SHSP domain-containing protein n=1 Tax=Dioscorea zingiberensis TaxID=325984 RepID=A0A9D5D0F8_9LILI|nr:hypothetical protein J5N97_009940 [Dioscorea zingiberensis]